MNDWLLAIPLGIGVLILAALAWRMARTRHATKRADRGRLQAAADAKPPAGAVLISSASGADRPADQSGRIMLVLDGSFSANLGAGLLTLLERCHLAGSIGSILLI